MVFLLATTFRFEVANYTRNKVEVRVALRFEFFHEVYEDAIRDIGLLKKLRFRFLESFLFDMSYISSY